MKKKRGPNWKQAAQKKPAKPRREPIVELTEDEREEEASQAIEKAVIHLKEAEEMAPWGKAPNACAHAAYYAMHFVAVAALFRSGGVGKHKSVPKSHEHVLRHYIKLAEASTSPIKESAMMLNRALNLRLESDYFINDQGVWDSGMHGASKNEAAEMTAEARKLLNAWMAVWKQ
ncbi:HEPN domain-containing protein [Mesorhizobium loti]|nr:HEPN domain-containing protein [Mesorhizobium loti]